MKFFTATINLSGKTEKLEYTISKLMEVAKELQESKKVLARSDVSSKKKLTKRYLIIYLFHW